MSGTRRIALFEDRMSGGHGIDFVEAVAGELLERGHEVLLLSSRVPEALSPGPALAWHRLEDPGFAYKTVGVHRRRRAELPGMALATRRHRTQLLVALNLDDQYTVAPALRAMAPRTAFVLHQVPPRLRGRRSVRAAGHVRFTSTRLLRRLSTGRSRLVTPSALVRDELARVDPGIAARVVDHPVHRFGVEDDVVVPDERTLLFPGLVRSGDKGIDVVLAALEQLTRSVTLRVAGRNEDAGARPTRVGGCDVVWRTERLSRRELGEEYLRAELVVLPHGEAFARAGGISATLHETLWLGRPAVVSTVLAGDLPPDYRGAVLFDPADPADLTRALEDAWSNLDELTRAAATTGKAWARSRWTVERFVDQVLDEVWDPPVR